MDAMPGRCMLHVRRLSPAACRLCQRAGHRPAEIGVWQQGGKLGFSLRLSRDNEAPDLLVRRNAKWPDTWLGQRRIIGECQNRNTGRTGDRCDGGGFGRCQRPEYQTVSIGDGGLSRGRGTCRTPAGIETSSATAGRCPGGRVERLAAEPARVPLAVR